MPIPVLPTAIVALVFVAACPVLAGCLSQPDTPTIEITSPLDGWSMRTGDITVRVNVNHFRTVDRQGEANAPGEGHIHLYMDVDPMPDTPGKAAIPADANATWADIAVSSHTFYGVPPGPHTFAVQLVNNDHTPIEPPVNDSVEVTVTG
jgi:hypothetical protein